MKKILNSIIRSTFLKSVFITLIVGSICINGGQYIANASEEYENNHFKENIVSTETNQETNVAVVDKTNNEQTKIPTIEITDVTLLDKLNTAEEEMKKQEEQKVEVSKEPEPEYLMHITKPGETLSKISYTYYDTTNKYLEIAQYNNISNPNSIKCGQEIKIPMDIDKVEKQITITTNSEKHINNTGKSDLASKISKDYNVNYNDAQNIVNIVNEVTSTKYTNVPSSLALAVISKESRFNISALSGDGSCYGLMQVHTCNHKWISDSIGMSNKYNSSGHNMYLEAKPNIMAGCHLLSDLINKYGQNNLHAVLMAYNGGEGYLNKMNNKGIYSTEYSRTICNRMDYFK